jgi:RND family efflux transporter MFP subunit
MFKIMIKIKSLLLKHKAISLIVLLLVVGVSVYAYKQLANKPTETKMVIQTVKKGNIEVSVSGTGQISSLDEVEVRSKVSGDIVYANAEIGDNVKKWALLFQIDNSDALKNLKQAELSLESAELTLEEIQDGTDDLSLLQAENSLTQAKETKEKAESNLTKSYEDSFNIISNVFLDLPTLMTGLKDVIFGHDACVNGTQENYSYYASLANTYDNRALKYKQEVYDKYQTAKSEYDTNLNSYKETNRYSNRETIEILIDETYETTKAISDLIKSTNNLIDFYKYTLTNYNVSYVVTANTHLSTLSGYTSKTNTHLSNLLSANNNIKEYKESIVSSNRTISEKELALANLKDDSSDLELRTQQLTVEQKQSEVDELKDSLVDYFVYAPFGGTITSVDVSRGDAVSSNSALTTIITKEKIATITLNEIDAVRVKTGQKVKITLDAIDDLEINGEVSQVDPIGTVSQGVVSYNVKISFDSNDERIKPGMSISASISIDSATDVLIIQSNLIKTEKGESYVNVMLDDGKTEKRKVEAGLSNDIFIEIKNGLSEGEKVTGSASTTSGTNKTNNSKGNNNYSSPPGGDMMRIMK